MYADLGPGQMIELEAPSPEDADLLYSHEYVANRFRGPRPSPLSTAERTNLYVYVGDNPINSVDPTGLKQVCGFYVWEYTGSWCNEDWIYQGALDAAAGVVSCWWQCEREIHGTVCGKVLTTAEVVSGTVSALGARVPKQWLGYPPVNPNSPYTSIARAIAKRIDPGFAEGGPRSVLEKIGRSIGRSTGTKVAKGAVVVFAVVEAGISWSCKMQCD